MAPGRRQGKYWLATIPSEAWTPELPEGVLYCKGQMERGTTTGYSHWQVTFCFEKKVSLRGVKAVLPDTGHYELSRSEAANAYVWKEDTRVPDTQFEFGSLPINRNSKPDWERVWQAARDGDVNGIPFDIRFRHYKTIRTIRADYAKPTSMERVGYIYWGATGTGKSRTAWEQAGMDAYPKDPRTKWWDGYTGQENIVVDEFRGAIDISHILRWTDRYPVLVEIKGASVPLMAKKFWFTSNLDPNLWFPELDQDTRDAFFRRFEVRHFE